MKLRIGMFGMPRVFFLLPLLVSCGGGDHEAYLAGLRTAYLKISGGLVYEYGSVIVGQSKAVLFDVTNTGLADASEIEGDIRVSVFRFTGGTYPGTNGDCPDTLPVGSSCKVEVEFAPTFYSDYETSLRLIFFDGVRSATSDDAIPQVTMRGRGR